MTVVVTDSYVLRPTTMPPGRLAGAQRARLPSWKSTRASVLPGVCVRYGAAVAAAAVVPQRVARSDCGENTRPPDREEA